MSNTAELKGMQETWERAATAWWDAWARSPAFLARMGRMLEAQLGIRKVAGRAADEWLEAVGFPSAREHERLLDRVGALEARIAEMEMERAATSDDGSGPGARADGAKVAAAKVAGARAAGADGARADGATAASSGPKAS